MDTLKKYRENAGVGLMILTAPSMLFFGLYPFFYIMDISSDAGGLLLGILISILFILYKEIFLTIFVGLIIFITNVYKYFDLKKQLITENSFQKGGFNKKYIKQKIILLIVFVLTTITVIVEYEFIKNELITNAIENRYRQNERNAYILKNKLN